MLVKLDAAILMLVDCTGKLVEDLCEYPEFYLSSGFKALHIGDRLYTLAHMGRRRKKVHRLFH